MTDPVRIIGIDPGLVRCGWGIVEASGNRLGFVASGTITPKVSQPLAQRLKTLFEQLSAIIALHQPDEAAVEEVFVNAGGVRPCNWARRAGWC